MVAILSSPFNKQLLATVSMLFVRVVTLYPNVCVTSKIEFQTKLIVLLGAISDLILTRQNSLKQNLSIRMQLMTKSMCVVNRVGSISESVFDVRDLFDRCSYRQS